MTERDDEESLAAHAGFLRGLARGLLFDRAAADDVAQRALLAALKRGGAQGAPAGFSLRAWLAGVVRNLARQEGREAQRRAARERAAARPEAVPSAADSAARLELLQRVVMAVRALDEPYRTVVLLRFFDGMKPAAIARRTGAPVETVRTRLKRALEQLRSRLDSGDHGERAAWGLLLLPTALPATDGLLGGVTASVTFHALAAGGLGALAMSTKVKAVIGAVAALVTTAILVSVLKFGEPAERLRSSGVAPVAAPLAAQVDDDTAGARTAAGDAAKATRVEIAPLPPALDPSLTFVIRGTTSVDRKGPTGGLRVHAQLFEGYDAYEHREGERAPAAEADLASAADGELLWALRPPRGTVTLVVTSREPDYAPLEKRRLLLAGDPPKRLDLTFNPLDAIVVGKVVDERGAPLADAKVQSYYGGAACACDEKGEYRVRASSSWAQWMLSAWAPGFAETTAPASLAGPGTTTTLDFRLHSDFSVRGRITDEAGAPVAGATVKPLRTFFNQVESDHDGRYEMHGFDPLEPRQDLHFQCAGYASVVAVVESARAAAGGVTLDIVLSRGACVEGIVLGPDGAPVRGAELWIGMARYFFGAPTAVSRDDGTFVFPHLAAGEETLGGAKLGLPSATTRIVVPPAPERLTGIVLRFAAGRFLAGLVTDPDGAPIPGAAVSYSRDGSGYDGDAHADGEGRFRLEPLPDTPLVFRASAKGYVSQEQRGLALDRNDVVFVIPPAGKLAGRVVDAESGEPLRRFRIRFVRPTVNAGEHFGGGYEYSWAEPGRTFSTDDGVWRCDAEAIEPGSIFAVEATAEGYAPALAPRVICAIAPDPADFVLRLSRGAHVIGRVVGAGGAPVAGALVTLATPSVPVNPSQKVERDARWVVRSDATGAFEIAAAPPGECTLVVEHPDWVGVVDGPFEVPTSGSAASRVIELARGGRIEGVLLDASGRPDVGRDITLYPASNEGPLARMEQATTDGEGRFVFERLATATYQVSSQLRSDLTAVNELSARVVVTAPQTATVRLEPLGNARVTGRVTSAGPLPASIEITLHWVAPADAGGGDLRFDRGAYARGERFEFPRVEPGTYHVTASCFIASTREWKSVNDTITVADGATVDIVLRL